MKILKNAKNGQIVTKVAFFLCLSDWELKFFWLEGLGDQKSQFWQISKFWPKKNLKSVTSTIYAQNGQKNTKIPKIDKNDQIVTKVLLFWCLSDWELNCFWLGGSGDQKSQFWHNSKFWPKKILNQSPLQSRQKMAKKQQNTEKFEKWRNCNKSVIFLMS